MATSGDHNLAVDTRQRSTDEHECDASPGSCPPCRSSNGNHVIPYRWSEELGPGLQSDKTDGVGVNDDPHGPREFAPHCWITWITTG
jgi:hypothetical protein